MSNQLEITKIRLNGGTQPRAVLDPFTIDEYADNMANGDSFPPVTVFNDGAHYWLADGFHRLDAHKQLGLVHVNADVRQGTQRDAVLFSVSANYQHGKRRTNADKRRSVMVLLNDSEWVNWSDREIARQCKVGKSFVNNLRPSLSTVDSERTYVTKHGTTATMNTGKIGKPSIVLAAREMIKDTPLADNPQAIKELAKLPADDQIKIAYVASQNAVEHAETIPFMHHHLKQNSDTWEEIEKTGTVQPGEESEAVHISAHPLELASATRFKSDIHAGIAMDMKNGRQKPKTNRAGDENKPANYDLCQTPPQALDPLLPYLRAEWTIWEPAKGEGYLEGALYDSGLAVVSGDILTGENFFDYEPGRWECLVTNPPFSIKYKWLDRCYELGKPFALLLPVETLGAKTAQKHFREYGVQMIFIDGRVNFKMPNLGWDGAGAQFPTAWFTFGLDLPQTMIFSKHE